MEQRAEVALIGSTLAGTPLHQVPTNAPLELLPADFDEDDEEDDDELFEFNPEGNYS